MQSYPDESKAVVDRDQLPVRHVVNVGYKRIAFATAAQAAAAYRAISEAIGEVDWHSPERHKIPDTGASVLLMPSLGDIIIPLERLAVSAMRIGTRDETLDCTSIQKPEPPEEEA